MGNRCRGSIRARAGPPLARALDCAHGDGTEDASAERAHSDNAFKRNVRCDLRSEPGVNEDEARRRFAASPVARLGTVRPDGSPHLVPVTFAVDGDTVYTAIDAKPKRSRRLQRVENLEAEPRCTLLVDHYDGDWSRLWWVRADGHADVVDDPSSADHSLELLVARYPDYADAPPAGPVIVVHVSRWHGWAAS